MSYDPHKEVKQGAQKAAMREKLYQQFQEEMRNHPRVKELAEKHNADSMDRFIKEWSQKKLHIMEIAPVIKKQQQQQETQWVENAFEGLEQIQQKKLFDLQCLWRANQANVPEIKSTYDFKYWEDNILNCPFIEPVTEQEVEFYRQYLQSNNYENSIFQYERWQDYSEIKLAYHSENENRNFPEWYDFHNGRTGKTMYLSLPDTKGEKEKFYLTLWGEEFHKLVKEKAKKHPPANTDKRPWLNYHNNSWLSWFVQTFEDKETQEKFKAHGGIKESFNYQRYEVDQDIRDLSESMRLWPIQGWFDWREAIHKTAMNYRVFKIAEALPDAYDQYRLHTEMGLGFEEDKKGSDMHNMLEWHERILRGRELNGEPRNFDY